MPDPTFETDVLSDLLDGVNALGQISADQKVFTTLYSAFRAGNQAAFQRTLASLNLTVRCSRICEWMRTKEYFFVCNWLCGPLRPIEKPNLRLFAETIVKITSDPAIVKEIGVIFDKRDQDGFKKIIEQYNLGSYCRLFCHWVCVVRYRLICRLVCTVEPIPHLDFVAELQAAGHVLRQLLASGTSFDDAVAASNAGDSDKLSAAIRKAGIFELCYLACEWFCSWRCALATSTLCVPLDLPVIKDEIAEAYQFASTAAQLYQNPNALQGLSAAIGKGDSTVYTRLITDLKLQPYCIQFAYWICALRCWRFCRLVCPPVFNLPWFTHVGDFGIIGDISTTNGLTTVSRGGHAGPNFAFAGNLKLRGFCPKYDPAHAGAPMAYRFLVQPAGAATPTPIAGGQVSEVLVGTRYTLWNGNPLTLQSVRIRGTGVTSPTPPTTPPGPNPPDHYIVPDPQGWVQIDLNALDDGFNGWLMGFASATVVPGGDPLPGSVAGVTVPPLNQRKGTDAAIIFQATRVSTIAAVNGGGTPDYTNQLGKIHINNWSEVNLIDLLEFAPGACTPLTTALHIQYTTDHEQMAHWFIDMVTAATVSPAPVFPSGSGPRGAFGANPQNISAWPNCSYLVRLHTLLSITDGLIDDSDKWNFKTFCIGRKATPLQPA
jgi:hypothetical protein